MKWSCFCLDLSRSQKPCLMLMLCEIFDVQQGTWRPSCDVRSEPKCQRVLFFLIINVEPVSWWPEA